jgi:hypothetical protein
MAGVQSKQKGNTFERKIANRLSERFEKVTGILKAFTRNQNSGSFFGASNQKRMQTHDVSKAEFGDIIAPSNFLFSVECKHYKTPPTFASIIAQHNSTLNEWIGQAEQDATNAKKMMCVIMKFNNVPETVILKTLFGTLKPMINYKEYYIVSLDDFLKQDDSFFFAIS